MSQLDPTPSSLVQDDGTVRYGVFDKPFRRLGLEGARLEVRGRPAPPSWVRFRLKRWQHFALVLPDLFVGFAMVDAGFLKTSWCSVADRKRGNHFEHGRQAPVADVQLSEALWNERSHFRGRGYGIGVHNHLEEGEHRVRIRIDRRRGRPAVQADLVCLHDLERNQPLVVSMPVGPNRAAYSHKVALPLEGRVRVGEREHVADPENSFALLDVHKAHYPRHTWWRWATFAGRDDQGRLLAMNLTANVNREDHAVNENVFWIDGTMQRLSPARFNLDRRDPMAPWRLSTAEGEVDLVFTPEGRRRENVRLLFARSVFQQPWGRFRGRIRTGDDTYEIPDLFGICEDHDALW